jgi:hypothetical protein
MLIDYIYIQQLAYKMKESSYDFFNFVKTSKISIFSHYYYFSDNKTAITGSVEPYVRPQRNSAPYQQSPIPVSNNGKALKSVNNTQKIILLIF